MTNEQLLAGLRRVDDITPQPSRIGRRIRAALRGHLATCTNTKSLGHRVAAEIIEAVGLELPEAEEVPA